MDAKQVEAREMDAKQVGARQMDAKQVEARQTNAKVMEPKQPTASKSRRKLRMVVKIGSSSITDAAGRLSEEKVGRIVNQVADIEQAGVWQVVLVSSGAVATGLGKLGWHRTNITLPEKQAAASVGQGLLMHTYEQMFKGRGLNIGQVLLTRSDVEDRSRFVHIRNTLMTLLRHGIVPIVNENDTVAVEEIRFGDNDTLASLVALVTEAHQLVLLTDIDGLYTANPSIDKNARLISDVFEITPELEAFAGDAGSNVGTGGMRTKMMAAKMAVAGGCDVVVAAAGAADVLYQAVAEYERKPSATTRGPNASESQSTAYQHRSEESVYRSAVEDQAGWSGDNRLGTRFHANSVPVSLRKAWLIHGSKAEGQVVVDAGAVRALTDGAASLLLPGVVGVSGDFREGATVELAGPDGTLVGRGIVSFSANDLELLLSRRQSGERLHNLPEVIHRNDMAVYEEISSVNHVGREME